MSVRLISRHSDVVSQLLPSESFDIGIAELPIDETSVTVSKLSDALRRRAAAAPSAGRAQAADARSCCRAIRWWRRRARCSCRPSSIATFAAAGAQLNAVVEAEFIASLCGLVAAGTGWSLVDPLSAESFSHLGLVARPFEPAILYEIGVFHRRDREPSMLAAAFLELLEGKLGG